MNIKTFTLENCASPMLYFKNFIASFIKTLCFPVHIVLLLLFLISHTPSVEAQYDRYFEAISRFANDTDLLHGQLGICVMDVNSGQILAAHNSTMSLIPASNMKIVTTAAGLKILGDTFTFKTELQYDGLIQDSTLNGNIYIKGFGDPTLGSPLFTGVPSMQMVLDSFTHTIQRLGIKKINGKIIGDGTAFEPATATMTWLWEDIGNYYGAGPSGLNFNENLYKLNFIQNPQVGIPPSVASLDPFVPYFKVFNEVNSINGGGDDAYIFTAPYSNVGIVRGTIPAGNKTMSISGSIPDPPFFTAWHLRRTMMETGIEVTDSASTQLNVLRRNTLLTPRQTFFTWHSPMLSAITHRANQESVNLYCEAILRAIAFQQTGVGSNDKGVEIVKQFWAAKGVDVSGMFMQDGSGLSPRNGLTPLQISSMLRNIAVDNGWFTTFRSSLPVAGLSGTMKNMFKKYPSVIGKIWAKSGTISRVRAYSGYTYNSTGQMIAFSIIANNFTCSQNDIRKKLELFMSELVK